MVLTLNSVDAAFIQNIAMSFAAILSAEYADKLLAYGKPSDINQKPIGTGPFVFKSYQKDSNIRYTGNKHYCIYLDEVEEWGIRILEDAAKGVKAKTAVHICYGYGVPLVLKWKTKDTDWSHYARTLPLLPRAPST